MSEVVRLPNAARRKVKQPGRFAREFREAHPWPGEYRFPACRDASRAIIGLIAAEIVMQAIAAELSIEARQRVQIRLDRLHGLTGEPVALRAAAIFAASH